MKPTLVCSFCLLLIVACQKQNYHTQRDFLPVVKTQLQNIMLKDDFTRLDFKRVVMMKVGNDSVQLLRIDLNGSVDGQEFVLLQTAIDGTIIQGRLIAINGISSTSLHGTIVVRSLHGEPMVHSVIEDGFIMAFHPSMELKGTAPYSQEDPYKEMPEVIIVCSYVNNEPVLSTWMMTGLFGHGSGGLPTNGGAYYGPYDPGSGSGGGYGGGSYPEGVVPGEVMLVDYENQAADPAININEYIECFNAVADDGATCSIEIFTDIPVDNDPSKLFDWKNETPGHTFLQIKKQNGSVSVQQNLGFYPTANWKTIVTPAPVAGKFVDNEKHEFNASIKMNINAAQLSEVLIKIQYLARFIRYDIDEYNCTDFALEVFNTTRTQKLEIPKYDIPGGMAPYGTSTPQGLYRQLQLMKIKGHAEAGNITTGIVKGWVGISKGACK